VGNIRDEDDEEGSMRGGPMTPWRCCVRSPEAIELNKKGKSARARKEKVTLRARQNNYSSLLSPMGCPCRSIYRGRSKVVLQCLEYP
jgi:hypothetical protein